MTNIKLLRDGGTSVLLLENGLISRLLGEVGFRVLIIILHFNGSAFSVWIMPTISSYPGLFLTAPVCLDEEVYSVQSGTISSASALRNKLTAKSCQDKSTTKSQSVLSSAATDSSLQAVRSVGTTESDMDIAYSQNFSSACQNVSAFAKEEEARQPDLPDKDKELEGCIADDSEADDDDLYLSDCRICLVGFNASDVRKLVGIVRQGGGSRYMSCSERLTHIVVGEPSDV